MISDSSSLLALGGLFIKNSKLDKAETVFKKYIELCSDDFRGYFMFAKVLYLKENYLSSLEYFDKSIALNPTSNDSFGAAAAVAIKLNRPECAADYCRKVCHK
jgi:tetratricopeptide (TPR) repeat protein